MPAKKGERIRKKGLKVWWEERQAKNPYEFNSFTYNQIDRLFKTPRTTDVQISQLIGKTRQQVATYRDIWGKEGE